jgi:LmbE family N-acetylglucosaminyl deacetylase
MKFHQENSAFFLPAATDLQEALKQTTHLAVTAHQDDTEILAYSGIAECFERDDLHFSNVTVTNGAGSPRAGKFASYTDEEMQKIRREEQNEAARIGRYAAQFHLNYASSEVKDSRDKRVVDDLYAIFEAAEAQVIYLHNPADKHDTHVGTMLRALEALKKLPAEKRPRKVYGCEVWRDLDWLMDSSKAVLKTDSYPELAAELIAVFDSQISGGKRYDLATLGRRLANATYFASHAVDSCDSMNFAVDLTPVIEGKISVAQLILDEIEAFKADVSNKLKNLE